MNSKTAIRLLSVTSAIFLCLYTASYITRTQLFEMTWRSGINSTEFPLVLTHSHFESTIFKPLVEIERTAYQKFNLKLRLPVNHKDEQGVAAIYGKALDDPHDYQF